MWGLMLLHGILLVCGFKQSKVHEAVMSACYMLVAFQSDVPLLRGGLREAADMLSLILRDTFMQTVLLNNYCCQTIHAW